VLSAVELRSVDRERNRFRVYRMWLQPTLFGGTDLVIEWGRIGARLRRRSEDFTQARWNELVTRRRRNGYG
jgi:predicted DNA-binding WGR domain protein